MKTKYTCLLLIILVFVTSCNSAFQTNPRVDKLFAVWDHNDTPGCAVGVIQNGQWVYKHAYGMADLDAKTPLTTHNTFYIGSMAKQFTAMSILLLAEQGKISLNDDIRKYLPEMPDYGTPITVQDLIHHTSGIKDYLVQQLLSLVDEGLNPYDQLASFNGANSLEWIAKQKELDFSPGDKYAYSNSDYFLLGIIIERVSGSSLRQFAEESIFKPLGMSHTQFRDNISISISDLAVGNIFNADGSRLSTRQIAKDYHLVGDGGLYTTLEDLFKWDQNFYHNQLGKGDSHLIEQMYSVQKLNDGNPNDYAFGLVVTTYHNTVEIEHGGGFIGYSSDMARFPEKKLTVIELCNIFRYETSEAQDRTPLVADLFLTK
jgi:CubicO group peptidase (beta-lactamase class C family)